MADIFYPGGQPIEAEGWKIMVNDGTDWLEVPDVADINLSGAVSQPTTKRTQRRVVKSAGKPGPLTVTGSIPFWRPDFRPCRLLTDRLHAGNRVRVQVFTPPEALLNAKAAALTFAIAATTGAITVAGTGAAAFDWADYEPGTYIKFGGTAADYYLLDRVDSTGKGYATQPHVSGATQQKAAAQADLVAAQLESDEFWAHVTEAPGSTVNAPASTEGETASSNLTLEATDSDVVNWTPVGVA